MKKLKLTRGYAAIFVVMILSAILTSLALIGSLRSLLFLSDETDSENHAQGIFLAKSCAFIALQTLETNPNYVPRNIILAITPKDTCTIDSIAITSNILHIFTHSYQAKTLSIVETDIQWPIVGVPRVTKQSEATSIPP